MKSYILLENVVFYAHHGVYEYETLVGNTFIVNVKMEVDLKRSGQSDQLDDTVSYADVYNIIKEEMEQSSKLLEHVAYRIMNKLKSTYSQIGVVELKLSKQNPPVGGQVDCASVLLID